MDGMGETHDAMAKGETGADPEYTHELGLPEHGQGFIQEPRHPSAEHGILREAEVSPSPT